MAAPVARSSFTERPSRSLHSRNPDPKATAPKRPDVKPAQPRAAGRAPSVIAKMSRVESAGTHLRRTSRNIIRSRNSAAKTVVRKSYKRDYVSFPKTGNGRFADKQLGLLAKTAIPTPPPVTQSLIPQTGNWRLP